MWPAARALGGSRVSVGGVPRSRPRPEIMDAWGKGEGNGCATVLMVDYYRLFSDRNRRTGLDKYACLWNLVNMYTSLPREVISGHLPSDAQPPLPPILVVMLCPAMNVLKLEVESKIK